MIEITADIGLAEEELEETFIRAPGPGGQNVNKVASAVQLRFDAAHSSSLPESILPRLKKLAGRRMTRDGVIVISASRFRSQERNRQDARDRLVALIREAATPPKRRRPTRVPRGARRQRLESKRKRSQIKKGRGRVGDGD